MKQELKRKKKGLMQYGKSEQDRERQKGRVKEKILGERGGKSGRKT